MSSRSSLSCHRQPPPLVSSGAWSPQLPLPGTTLSIPGAFATHLWLPPKASEALAPLYELWTATGNDRSDQAKQMEPDRLLPSALALLASAGACYQAQAVAGMIP